jgi:diadenosine tetraphosphate (Ap4A) HIT family hydrolase
MPGYVCLVSRVHVIELHELSVVQAQTFILEVQRVSRALAVVTVPVKLNYEIHGNTLPHLHMHIFPRHPGDPFEDRAIEPRLVTQAEYAPGEYSAMRDRLVRAISEGIT